DAVSESDRVDVHDAHRPLVLEHSQRRGLPGADLAKDAVGHRGLLERSMAKSGGPALDGNRPAVGVGYGRVLDPDERVVELLGQLTALPAVDDDPRARVAEFPDGRAAGGRPGAPHLLERPIPRRARDLGDADPAHGAAE